MTAVVRAINYSVVKKLNNYTASNKYSMAINAVYMYQQIYTHQQNDKCMDNKYGKKKKSNVGTVLMGVGGGGGGTVQ